MFLGEKMSKYHRTITTCLNTLLGNGFIIEGVIEPQPTKEALETLPRMTEELGRPMMLLVKAIKK